MDRHAIGEILKNHVFIGASAGATAGFFNVNTGATANWMLGWGPAMPAAGSIGWAHGADFRAFGSGASSLATTAYCNIGTGDSSSFTAL